MSIKSTSIACLFDMDGVLVHTNPYHKKAFKRFLDEHDVDLTDDELRDHVYGRTNSEIFPYIFKDDYTPEKGKKWADEKESLFRDLYKEDAKPVPGLVDFLKKLKEAGVKSAVGTSAPVENLDFIMDTLDLRRFFDVFLHSGSITKSKPDPEIYLKAADQLNTEPDNCVVFEDSVAGVKAGLNAGMNVVAVATTHSDDELAGAHLVIDDFEDIDIQYLQRLCER